MTWNFPETGEFQVRAEVLSHFSCKDKVYVEVNGKTVLSGGIPEPDKGYCCDRSGTGCRKTAKDNLFWMSGQKLKISKGDKVEYGGTLCVCADERELPTGGHGSYCGIKRLLFVGSGSGSGRELPACNF